MKPAHNIPVLMYHHVSPSAGMITSSPLNFERQIAWLAREGYHALDTAGFAAFLAGQAMPRRSVLITFDDGYLDNWVYAHPVLKRHGMKAVIFLVTGWVHDGPRRAQAGSGLPLPATPEHKAGKRLLAEGRGDELILRWSEIEAMGDVFEFHSHTHTHTRWDQQARSLSEKRERVAHEMSHSRELLAARLGVDSTHLCWPQGHFDADYLAEARAAGYRYFYTTDAYGQNRPGSDPEYIYRLAVRNRGGASVGRRLRLAAHPRLGPLYNHWKRRARRHGEPA